MRRIILLAPCLALFPAAAEARDCSQVVTIGVPYAVPYPVPYELGPNSLPTFTWRVQTENKTAVMQTMRLSLVGISNVQNQVNPVTPRPVPPNMPMTWTLGRIAGPQPTVAQMQAAIRMTCQG